MNHEQNFQGKVPSDSSKVNLLDVLIVLAKYRRFLMVFPIAAASIALAIAFVLPPVFRASATFLPPQQQQSGASLLAQLGGAEGLLASAAGFKGPGELYVGILKSRTIADSLIKKFDLVQVYGISSQEKARLILAANTSIATGKDGLIAVAVEDKDKARAASLANAYVEELSRLTKTLAVTAASQRRLFYENQLFQTKENLATAEQKLKAQLNSGGVVSVDTDSRAILETMGRLRAGISAKEIELSSMKAFVTPNNQAYKQAAEELQSLRSELNRLENGAQNSASAPEANANSGLSNIKLLRDVKYNQMLYELLAKQFEAARLEEAKDGPLIQVLDPAVAPEHKFKPKRALIAIAAFFGALLVALAFIFVRESIHAAKRRPEVVAKVTKLRESLGR